MQLVDIIVRYGAVALLVAFAILAIRDGRRVAPTRYGALLSISIAALLLGTVPEALRLPFPLHAAVRIIDIPNIVFMWWLGRSMFEENFRLGRLEWTGFAVYSGTVAIFRLSELGAISGRPPGLLQLIDVVSFSMMAHLAYVTLRGRGDDLIAARRAARVYFTLALAGGTAVALFAESVLPVKFEAQVSTLRAVVALVLVSWGLLWLTRLQPELMRFEPAPLPAPPPSEPKIDPRDAGLRGRLIMVMESDKAYAEPSLTIRTLAERLQTPEHRLRALINQGLGHRNFSAFINAYRIAAAKAALADPEEARTPVLTIAMDTGFGSLAPFNRAFKAAEGVTPTEFRRAALENPDRS